LQRALSLRSQFLTLLLLLGLGTGLWLARNEIGNAFASLQKPTGAETGNEGAKKSARKGRAAPVIVARVSSRRNDETIAAIGTARALRFVTLYADAEGEIVDVPIRPGQHVAKGEPLLKLTTRRAQLAVDLAKKALEDAVQKLKRVRYLLEKNVNSGASVEDAMIAVDRAELEVKQAEENLRDRTLEAPFDGVVGIPKVEPGDRVSPTTPVVTLDDRSELLVEFEVAEKFLARIKVGDHVVATTPSYARRNFSGHLGFIDTRVDPTSRTVTVRAIIPNDHDLLRPGMSFAIELELRGETYPAVPELSLQWSEGHSYVWRVEGDKVRKVVVETVRRMNSIILVDGPITSGDLIVVEGVQRLRDGTMVTYEKPEPGSELPPAPKRSARTDSERKG
jgi:RND family efflux transporter MFP subunit